MNERWICNASPLISLCRINHEFLLHELATEVVVPQAVATEILAGSHHDRAWQCISAHSFTIIEPISIPSSIQAWDLGAGETAVLAHTLADSSWTALLDDGAARKCARSFSLPVRGTLGIILLAQKHHLIPSAKDTLLQLRAAGFRLDNAVIKAALAHIGEEWPH